MAKVLLQDLGDLVQLPVLSQSSHIILSKLLSFSVPQFLIHKTDIITFSYLRRLNTIKIGRFSGTIATTATKVPKKIYLPSIIAVCSNMQEGRPTKDLRHSSPGYIFSITNEQVCRTVAIHSFL